MKIIATDYGEDMLLDFFHYLKNNHSWILGGFCELKQKMRTGREAEP